MNSPNRANGAILFDLDGTLSDTSGDIGFSANFIRRRVGKPEMTTAQVMALVGHGAPYLLSGLTDLPVSENGQFKVLLDEYQSHYSAHQTQHSRLYPGVRDLLEDLQREGFDMYILSNKPHLAVIAELEGHRIQSYFSKAWGAGALSALKPNPVGIHLAMEKSNVPKERVLMVGDMIPDMEVAKNAGVASCYVTWGFGGLTRNQLEECHIAHNPASLLQIIERVFS